MKEGNAMIKYKILKVGEQQNICGIVLKQEVTEIAELGDFNTNIDESERISNIIREKENGRCDGHYFIAKYDNEKYQKCVDYLLGETTDGDEYFEPSLVGAEHDIMVACDMAHKNLTNEQKWNDITYMAERYNLMDMIVKCINEWYYENEL